MSTKIYSVYICPKFRSIDHMHSTMMKIRSIIVEELNNRLKKRIAEEYIYYMDDCIINRKKPKKKYSDFVFEAMKKYNESEHSQIRDCEYDFHYKVMLFPYRKNIYLKIFSEGNNDLEKHFKDIGCKDFHFQNSTDRPDKISKQEWNKRQRIWESILKEGIWVNHGFEYDFSPNKYSSHNYMFEKVKPFFPSLKIRAERIAKDYVFNRFIEKVKKKKGKVLEKGYNMYIAARKYLQTPNGKKELKRRIEEIKLKLNKAKDKWNNKKTDEKTTLLNLKGN